MLYCEWILATKSNDTQQALAVKVEAENPVCKPDGEESKMKTAGKVMKCEVTLFKSRKVKRAEIVPWQVRKGSRILQARLPKCYTKLKRIWRTESARDDVLKDTP